MLMATISVDLLLAIALPIQSVPFSVSRVLPSMRTGGEVEERTELLPENFSSGSMSVFFKVPRKTLTQRQ